MDFWDADFQERKFSPKRKFWAGHPCGRPAKNFGQALQILGKQAFRNGHPTRTSMKNFGLKNFGLIFRSLDLSPCNFATAHFPAERSSFTSLWLRDRPFDSLRSEFLSPLNFATHEREDPFATPHFSLQGISLFFGGCFPLLSQDWRGERILALSLVVFLAFPKKGRKRRLGLKSQWFDSLRFKSLAGWIWNR